MRQKRRGLRISALDLIFAIPGSTLESWKHSLQSAIDLGVQHISAYALTYEEGTPLQKAVAAGEVEPVDEETDRAMYETAIENSKGPALSNMKYRILQGRALSADTILITGQTNPTSASAPPPAHTGRVSALSISPT